MQPFPRFFRVRQTFPRPRLDDVGCAVRKQLAQATWLGCVQPGERVAITAGSRGIANIAEVIRGCVTHFQSLGARPFIVPAMGSHGGATASGQAQVLASYGVTEAEMGCPIESSMDVVEVCQADEGFPVYFDRLASLADHVWVVNRVKPHTRFAGEIESGLMKMMLIGLGKQRGAEVYHRVIMNYSFDQIVRSVARKVIDKCRVLGGLAILENAYEETAELAILPPTQIESDEPHLLRRVKSWMPGLPFDHADLLIVDRIGKDISGTGMDTNVIGRKFADHGSKTELPFLHHIYVRGLTPATHGNATGLGIAEMCHRRVIETMDVQQVRMNCITAGHITAAMIPLDFPNDHDALQAGCQLAGYVQPEQVKAMWIADTLHLSEVECSEAFWQSARTSERLEIVSDPRPLEFDSRGDLQERFRHA